MIGLRPSSLLRGGLAFTVLASLLAAAVVACSGGGDDGSPSGDGPEAGLSDRTVPPAGDGGGGGAVDAEAGYPTPKEACEAYVKAECARAAECNMPMNCDRALALCPDYLFAPGSTRGVSDVLACAAVRRAQSCAELEARIDPACATPGTRKKGEPCEFNTQCESFSCSTGLGSCGTCDGITPPDSGCPKLGFSCGQNMHCPSPSGCVPSVAAPHLSSGDTCPAADGGKLTCPTDSPCSAAGPLADAGHCNPAPASGACLYELHQPYATVCRGGTECTFTDAASPDGICVTSAPAGYFCGTALGLTGGCAPGLYCPDQLFGGVCAPNAQLGVDGGCSPQVPCDPTATCRLNGSRGTCVPGVAIGAPCGVIPDAGSSFIACATGVCATIKTDAGSKQVCVNVPATDLQACSLPLSPCAQGLECGSDQLCHLPACPTDAGKD